MTDPCNPRWIHPSVVLVATDLSDLDRLMPYAMEQAQDSNARLILLHAISSSSSMSVDGAGLPYYDPTGALDSAEKVLWRRCESARQHGVNCHVVVREGDPTQQIAAAARQFNADRIVLGTRSRSRLGKMLLGSVAEQVLRSVNLPVITVGPEAHLAVPNSVDERVVLHATTLRETSRPSAALACSLAARLNATLVLVHVLPAVEEMMRQGAISDFDAAAARELQALADETAAGCNPQIETIVLHGNPFIEILAEAAARKASLIVLGATHRSAFENLMHDHTVYRVLAHARCPVLTLREAPVTTETAAEHLAASHS